MSYEEALDRTDPTKCKTVTPGSAEEKDAIERFKGFYTDYNREDRMAKVRHVFAENAYINDTLKEVNGIDAIEAYLLKSSEFIESRTFETPDIAVSGGDYYYRWVANIKFKTFKKGRVFRFHGISHVRFDEKGKVVLCQDFWDPATALFEHIPVLGFMIKLIKRRL